MQFQSTSRHIISEGIIAVLTFAFIGYLILNAIDMLVLSIGLIALLIFFGHGMVMRSIRGSYDVYFTEEAIKVRPVFSSKEYHIDYSQVLKLEYLAARKSTTTNKIEYQGQTKKHELRFKTIGYNEHFMEFVKFIKSKNKDVMVKAHPSDHYLNHLIQEKYGFNYRKVPKVK